jgi:hypothetical protein
VNVSAGAVRASDVQLRATAAERGGMLRLWVAPEAASELIEASGPHRFVWSAGSSGPVGPPLDLPEPVTGENAVALVAGLYAGAHL